LEENECKKINCDKTCATCYGTTADKCLTCFDDKVLTDDNKCECKKGFKLTDDGKCEFIPIVCHPNCSTCVSEE